MMLGSGAKVSSNFVQAAALESGLLAITEPGIGESIAGVVQRMSLLAQDDMASENEGHGGIPKNS